MKTITSLLIGISLFFGATPAYAYSGYVSNVWSGEHPYELRKIEENRRKRLAEQFEKYGYYTFDNPAYFHPVYARRSVLHPFYRKGGTSQYIDGRLARWRGESDPVLERKLSPDTYCNNFTYQRSSYRAQPLAYECF